MTEVWERNTCSDPFKNQFTFRNSQIQWPRTNTTFVKNQKCFWKNSSSQLQLHSQTYQQANSRHVNASSQQTHALHKNEGPSFAFDDDNLVFTNVCAPSSFFWSPSHCHCFECNIAIFVNRICWSVLYSVKFVAPVEKLPCLPFMMCCIRAPN